MLLFLVVVVMVVVVVVVVGGGVEDDNWLPGVTFCTTGVVIVKLSLAIPSPEKKEHVL